MILIRNINNRVVILLLTLVMICLVGYLDYITGEELSFSFFYIIPISFIALYKQTSKLYLFISTILASLIWFFAEYFTREYSSIFFPIWNAFVRLAIFSIIGTLLIYLKEKQIHLDILNKDLEAISKEKNKFIGIAAHDLRNPISSIYSYSDYLIDAYKDKMSSEFEESIQLIKQYSKNTLSIIENLLDVSKIESGNLRLTLELEDYISFIKDHITLNRILANRKNIKIVFETSLEEIIIKYDRSHLGEVIDNLLSNAIKYSNIDSEIIVKVSLVDEEIILTEVIDQGIGISENEQNKLFNYFVRTSAVPTNGETCTGLGLAIAKQMITLHRGKIGLKSSLNKGSNFFYTLPIINK